MGKLEKGQRAGISRATFIGAAGAAGAAGLMAATAGALSARAATATGAASSDAPAHCFFGANADAFPYIYNGIPMVRGTADPGGPGAPIPVPGLMGVRHYGEKPGPCPDDTNPADQCNNLKTAWPGYPISTTGPAPVVYSIYPIPDTVTNPDNAAFDDTIAKLTLLIQNAPPNAYLNAWHEALSLPYTGFDITAANMLALHKALRDLVHTVNDQSGSTVQYGSIFGGGANLVVGTPGTVWNSVPGDLDWYGVDVYGGRQNAGNTTCDNSDDLDTFIDNAKIQTGHYTGGNNNVFVPGYPKILIGETNYNIDTIVGAPPSGCPQTRADWFNQIATRMHHYGNNAVGILTFWRVGAELSGAYDPEEEYPDEPLGDRINDIINVTLT